MITAAAATRDVSLVGAIALAAPVLAMFGYLRIRGYRPDPSTREADRFALCFSGAGEVSFPADRLALDPETVRRVALLHGYVWTATVPDRKGRAQVCFRRLPPPANGSPWWEDAG